KELNVDQLRIGYFIERNEVYQHLIECFLQKYQKSSNRADLDSLYYYLSMEKARALKDLRLATRAFVYSDEYWKACEQLRLQQRRLREEADKFTPADKLDDLLSQIEAARFSLLAQRLRVGVNAPDSTQSRQEVVPSLATVLDRLKEAKLGLLLYHIAEETSFVLVAAGEEVKVVRLPVSPSALAAQIDTLMTPFHNVNADSVQVTPFKAAIAHRLYRLLVKPVEEALPLPPRLVIVPDLALMNLPIEMLLVERPSALEYTPSDSPAYADHFLLNRYTLVYTPSTTLLQEKSEVMATSQKYIVFANPFGSASAAAQKNNPSHLRTGWRFDPLPFAEVEAEQIKASKPQTQVRTRANATKAAFIKEAPQHQIVHIATHAFVDTTFDAFSGLVLAASDDSTDDGMLMGYE
ncbi:MAG: CHAT domain-containing protein, partial [bacterium]